MHDPEGYVSTTVHIALLNYFLATGVSKVMLQDLHAEDRQCSKCQRVYVNKLVASVEEDAVKIDICDHIVGRRCLIKHLETKNTCPTCDRELFEKVNIPFKSLTQRETNQLNQLVYWGDEIDWLIDVASAEDTSQEARTKVTNLMNQIKAVLSEFNEQASQEKSE